MTITALKLTNPPPLFLHELPPHSKEPQTHQATNSHGSSTSHGHPHHSILLQPFGRNHLQLLRLPVPWFHLQQGSGAGGDCVQKAGEGWNGGGAITSSSRACSLVP